MATRILTWHASGKKRSGDRIGPTYYIDADYQPIAVRMHAETAPSLSDTKVDILKDDVSIFSNSTPVTQVSASTKGPTTARGVAKTVALLPMGDNTEVNAEDFIGSEIDKGSWVHCVLEEDGGSENLTVHLELLRNSEDDESED